MYFLSALDPNYRFKGSRDPLGFQSIWSAAGHKAVKHLSTVSSNLKDFMILCYGHHLYGDRDPKGFVPFFLKFEQICAYARRIHNNETSFNGIEFVNKKVTDPAFTISLKHTILSNQRVYGIFGKYIRPLRDMGLMEVSEFAPTMENALSKSDKASVMWLINQILEPNNTEISVTRDQLKPIADLLKSITPEEQQLYRDYILKVPGVDHPQNNLYDVIYHNQDIAKASFQLHQIVQSMVATAQINDSLKDALINISKTDKVLHPLNLAFLNLLSKSPWTADDINNDQLFNNLPEPVNYNFLDENVRSLDKLLDLAPGDFVRELVRRNTEVSKQRGKSAWVIEEKREIKVLYGENGFKITEVDNETGYEFTYFLNNYLGLFKQIEMI